MHTYGSCALGGFGGHPLGIAQTIVTRRADAQLPSGHGYQQAGISLTTPLRFQLLLESLVE